MRSATVLYNIGGPQLVLWLLILLLPCLSLGMVQRQTLGPLHVHLASTPVLAPTDSWIRQVAQWWREKRDSAVFVHARVGALPQGAAPVRNLAAAADAAHTHSHRHSHAGWERHHHAPGDATALALDAVADEAAMASALKLLLMPVFGAPASSLLMTRINVPGGAWPQVAATGFRSRGTQPPLPPPRG